MNQLTLSAAERLQNTLQTIRQLEQRYGRDPGSVTLLAVSKRKPALVIEETAAIGQQNFGENYPDEALNKIQQLQHLNINWHFIGAIQSRKAAGIAKNFSWVHSVDRLKVATRLSERRDPAHPPLNICLQVNLDNEENKSGVSVDELDQLAEQCSKLPNLTLRGLMAIPAIRTELDDQRAVFAKLRCALEGLQSGFTDMDTLSMGMSADMEAAIAEGATIVRVGTAIFGARD